MEPEKNCRRSRARPRVPKIGWVDQCADHGCASANLTGTISLGGKSPGCLHGQGGDYGRLEVMLAYPNCSLKIPSASWPLLLEYSSARLRSFAGYGYSGPPIRTAFLDNFQSDSFPTQMQKHGTQFLVIAGKPIWGRKHCLPSCPKHRGQCERISRTALTALPSMLPP